MPGPGSIDGTAASGALAGAVGSCEAQAEAAPRMRSTHSERTTLLLIQRLRQPVYPRPVATHVPTRAQKRRRSHWSQVPLYERYVFLKLANDEPRQHRTVSAHREREQITPGDSDVGRPPTASGLGQC